MMAVDVRFGDYVLKFVVAGWPPQEPQVWLEGTATAAGQHSVFRIGYASEGVKQIV